MNRTAKPADIRKHDAILRRRNPLFQKFSTVAIISAILLIAISVFSIRQPSAPQAQQELVILVHGSHETSALTIIAHQKGFFSKYGLNVIVKGYPAGAYAIKELLSGNADFALASEFVGVKNIPLSPDLRIVAVTAKGNVNSFVIRNGRGITKPSDLKGKTIALPKGTAAEFFLGRYLTLHKMDIRDVNVLDATPEELIRNMINGSYDVVLPWEPYVYQLQQELGRDCTIWPAQSGQQFYWVLYTRVDVIRERPAMIRQYLRALKDAETFIYSHESEAKAIIRKGVNMPEDYINNTWKHYQFVLSLDQGLLLAMEDEARWIGEQTMPAGKQSKSSYLDLIYQDAMREITPSAVSIIR